MFRKNYYYLVAGLKEYTLEGDNKGFDALTVIREIRENVSSGDRRTVELFYTYYDIENIISLRSGRGHFSALGNFSAEELSEELAAPSRLPAYLGNIIAAYNSAEKEGGQWDEAEDLDMDISLERNLFAAYYKECAKSRSRFMRRWADFDRTLRNITAAFAARRRSIPVAEVIVGGGDIETALARSSAADFGIKGEVSYVDRIMVAVADDSNLLEKENRIDAIRWDMSEELTAMNYFDIDFILGYLVKIDIIYRWASLDPARGREMLQKLIDTLTGEGNLPAEETKENNKR